MDRRRGGRSSPFWLVTITTVLIHVGFFTFAGSDRWMVPVPPFARPAVGCRPVPSLSTALTAHAGIDVPLICGAMYPCSNPELVAAVSAAGGLGIVQPISPTYVHGHELRAAGSRSPSRRACGSS